ncbi:MAG: type III secretion system chaperone [Dongiaceae bacterium]
MTARDRLGEAVGRLGQRLGMPGLALNADGICALSIEGRLVLHLFADAAADHAVLYVPLGPLPAESRAAMHRSMLEANAQDGLPGALAIDPRTGEAMLVRNDPLRDPDDAAFERLLEQMIATALAWIEKIGRGGAPPAEDPAHAKLHMGGGLRA